MKWANDFWAWLERDSAAISAVAAAIQAAAIVFAVYQVYLTRTQIADARRGLQANVELQIQHDGRELLGSLKPDVYAYIYGHTLKSGTEGDAAQKIVQLLNYYASISRQHDIGALDDGFWQTTEREFCFFISQDHVQPFWEAAIKSGSYAPAFVEAGKQCQAGTPQSLQ